MSDFNSKLIETVANNKKLSQSTSTDTIFDSHVVINSEDDAIAVSKNNAYGNVKACVELHMLHKKYHSVESGVESPYVGAFQFLTAIIGDIAIIWPACIAMIEECRQVKSNMHWTSLILNVNNIPELKSAMFAVLNQDTLDLFWE